MAISGEWFSSLDGSNPERDPIVLIKTAIRTCKALTGIDLSPCTQCLQKKSCRKISFKQNQNEINYLYDELSAENKLAVAEGNSPNGNDKSDLQGENMNLRDGVDTDMTNIVVIDVISMILQFSDNVSTKREPKHYAELDVKSMKINCLRDKLEARGLSSEGLKPLIARLSKALNIEENNAQDTAEAENELAVAEENSPNGNENSKLQEENMNTHDGVDIDMSNIVVIDEYDSTKIDGKSDDASKKESNKLGDRNPRWHEKCYQLLESHTKSESIDKFKGGVMSLSILLDYRPGDNNKHCFEVLLFVELFNEMLMAADDNFTCEVISLSIFLDYRREDKKHCFEVLLFVELFNELLMAADDKFTCEVISLSIFLDYRPKDKIHCFEVLLFVELFNELLMAADDKFTCEVISLSIFLDYRPKDKIHCFEVLLFVELFTEMLMPDARNSGCCDATCHVSRAREEFYTMRCPVAQMRVLHESLAEVTAKDTLKGDNMYTCDQSGLVRAGKRAKRICLKKLPKIPTAVITTTTHSNLLNKELEEWIWKDSCCFLQDRNIFEHANFNFMWQMCGYIPQSLLLKTDVTFIAAQLSVSFFIETFIHIREKPIVVLWVELLTKQFNSNLDACEWLLTHMPNEFWWPVHILIKCLNQMVRHVFQRLVIHVIQRLQQSYCKLCLKIDTDLEDRDTIGNYIVCDTFHKITDYNYGAQSQSSSKRSHEN